MDLDLVGVFIFVIVITAITGGIINGVVSKILDYKRERRAIEGSPAPALASEHSDRMALIEDRLRVLERIATDPQARRGTELAQEIEQLRFEQEKVQ
ncbi:MAG: hypothetical protein AAF559_05915 [Pseudomonadota bacterium]